MNAVGELRKRGWSDLWRDPLTAKLYTLPAAMNIFRSRMNLPSLNYKRFRARLGADGYFVVEWQEMKLMSQGRSMSEALRNLADLIESADNEHGRPADV